MLNIFYSIIIFPIVQLIELCFVFVFRLFKNYGIAIVGVSVFFSIFTLPLYFIAEKYQQKERDIQKLLKNKIDKIKSVFKGDEQYMILSTLYKQNHYHPVYSIRSAFGLLIQIPFFIAAYSYLSHLEAFNGVSFFFIKDLGKPDNLLAFSGININLLPVLMTLINIISGSLYTKGHSIKDKIQVYGISFIFLILLYNSRSALVLYWTMNNIFSLIKNIVQKYNFTFKILIYFLVFFTVAIDIFLLFFHPGDLPKRLLAVILISSVVFLPLIINLLKSKVNLKLFTDKNILSSPYIFILSCFILFLLNGLIIPSSLISSSVGEFSSIGNRLSPFPFILNTLFQSAGIFLFWPIVIYFLFSVRIRHILTYIMIILTGTALINVFLITENFGFFTTTMILSEPKPFSFIPAAYITNLLLVLLCAAALFFLLYINKLSFILNKIKIIFAFQVITISALFGLCIFNIYNIRSDFNIINNQRLQEANMDNYLPHYTFSKSGKNILVVLIDAFVGAYIPAIFEEKPELYGSFNGFHWYPNTVSFSNHTLIGALPLYGGYEYAPLEINKRSEETLLSKQEEAYLLLPVLFSNSGFSVTVTDPPFDNYLMSNLAIFNDYPEIKTENLIGKYTSQWLRENDDVSPYDITELLDNNLYRFSLFKISPLFLRLFIYDQGKWLRFSVDSPEVITQTNIDDYSYLDSLDKITTTVESGNTYTAIYSHLPHNAAFFQAPEYKPVKNVTYRGTGAFANDAAYHVTMASFLLIGKWFSYLKDNDVYDNTRIIIVADHGRGTYVFPESIQLPNGDSLYSYNPLLMVKDFYANWEEIPISQSSEFMTNADTPLLALDGIIENPVNPFTGSPLQADKENGITLATIGAVSTYRHGKYTYNLSKNQWLFVRDNIFDPHNWSIP